MIKYFIDDFSFNMIECPKGDFWMGTGQNLTIENISKKCTPKHHVILSKNFLIGETVVTQDLWCRVMRWNPSGFKEKDNRLLPVENVTWYDCVSFCNQLSKLSNLQECYQLNQIEYLNLHIIKANVQWNKQANGFRLPTEAEWEYAANAGSYFLYSGSNDLDEIAWYHVNSGSKQLSSDLWITLGQDWDKWKDVLKKNKNQTHPIKTKKPNDWGIYDMTGNVLEWCHDAWHETIYQTRLKTVIDPVEWDDTHCMRSMRSSSFRNIASCENFRRSGFLADDFIDFRGFRILKCS